MGTPHRTLLVMTVVAGLHTACAYQRHFAPDPPKARYELREWPKGTVTVSVADERLKKTDDSEKLIWMITGLVKRALAVAEAPPTAPRTLQLSIVEHEVALKGPWWTASTQLHASLVEGQRVLATWDSAGEDKRWNLLPAYLDAERASQEAFERAIADLMTKLRTTPQP